jgi:hypothetical protein
MGQVSPFHDRNAPNSSSPRYHTDDECPVAQCIPLKDVRPGSRGFYRCEQCRALAVQDRRRQTQRPGAPIP